VDIAEVFLEESLDYTVSAIETTIMINHCNYVRGSLRIFFTPTEERITR